MDREIGADLLCERCGYVIEGLAEDGACPECGRAIALSLPARRVGSPAQNSATARSRWITRWLMVRHPKAMFDRVRMVIDGAESYLLATLALAGAPAWTGLFAASVVVIADEKASAHRPSRLLLAVLAVLACGFGWLMTLGLLRVLVAIEEIGLRVMSRQRRWRVGEVGARVVCAHAAAGWVVGGVLVGFVAPLVVLNNGLSRPLIPKGPALAMVPAAAMVGLLWFETLAYIGVRRCRFANRPREPA